MFFWTEWVPFRLAYFVQRDRNSCQLLLCGQDQLLTVDYGSLAVQSEQVFSNQVGNQSCLQRQTHLCGSLSCLYEVCASHQPQ